MPYSDPDREAEYQAAWRAAHPGYWRGRRRIRPLPVSRYQALDEDLAQQRELHRLSRRAEDDPDAYRRRERQWIQATWRELDDRPEG